MKKFIRFSLLSVIGVGVGYMIMYILKEFFQVWYIFSSALGEVVSFFVSFNVNKYWAFGEKEKDKTYKELALYTLVALTYFLINTSLMYVFTENFAVPYKISKLFVIIILCLPSYWATKKVFNNKITERKETMSKAAKPIPVFIGLSIVFVMIMLAIFAPDIKATLFQW